MRYSNKIFAILFVALNGYIGQILADLKLPILLAGPNLSNNINYNQETTNYNLNKLYSEAGPIIENIEIKSNITKRIDRTTITCFVKNPSIYKKYAKEISLSIELPFHNYKITNLTLQAFGVNDVYTGKTNEAADTIYEKYSKNQQTSVIVEEIEEGTHKSYNEAKMLSMKAIIPAQEKLVISLEYVGPLMKHGMANGLEHGSLNHIVHINPNQLVRNFSVNVYIQETLPIVNATVFEVRNEWPTFKYSTVKLRNDSNDSPEFLHVAFTPNEGSKKVGGYDMNGQFYTSYKVNKNRLLSKVGYDIAEFASYAEYERMTDVILAGIESVFAIILMIPFIILTEMVSAFYLIVAVMLGLDMSWYLKSPQWYELELEKEFAKMDTLFGIDNSIDSLGNKFDSFDDGKKKKSDSNKASSSKLSDDKNIFLDISKIPRSIDFPSSHIKSFSY